MVLRGSRERPPVSRGGGEEYGGPARRNAPPSRHLWVGNLSLRVTQAMLSEQFARFGEIEKIVFVPGRTYNFINFRNEEDAVIAMKALQGLDLFGFQMKIEFTKGEKSSSHEDDYHQNRAGFSAPSERGLPSSHRDRRSHLGSPEKYYDRVKDTSDLDPCEVLWLGFPSYLDVDEFLLEKAFSPYGEIVKITTFPGRSYAFVRFSSISAASRAKDALHGKLFDDPRVKITFARSEHGLYEQGRSSFASHSSSFRRANDELDFSQRYDPDFDKFGDSGTFDRNRSASLHGRRGGITEMTERDYSDELIGSPYRDRVGFKRELSPERHVRRRSGFDVIFPDNDSFSLPDAKRLKIGPFPDKRLSEYTYSIPDQEKQRGGSRLLYERNEPKPFNDGPGSVSSVRDEPWNDGFDVGLRRPKFTSETQGSFSTDLWKWEGTIAKGGTSVCRARCFPVGKNLDMELPEFLNCTARTTLAMLEKHFYQAASHSVVFFVPNTDSDITFYDEFMHYLGEKQRAAVAKLNEKTTLFLVPPSDFSERVLKVPGKMSISGVILTFQIPDGNLVAPHQPAEAMGFQSSAVYQKPISPDRNASSWGRDYDISALANMHSSTAPIPPLNRLYAENIPNTIHDDRISQVQHQRPALPTNHQYNEIRNPIGISTHPSQASFPTNSFNESVGQENMSLNPRVLPEKFSTPYIPGTSSMTLPGPMFSHSEKISEIPTVHPGSSAQTDQYAQLASLLGQRHQAQHMHSAGDNHVMANLQNILNTTAQSGTGTGTMNLPQHQAANNGMLPLQHNQIQQMQPNRIEVQEGGSDQGKKQLQGKDQVETEARLQATLQLAASLLQQIHQQGKT